MIDNETWDLAQIEELRFWSIQKYPLLEEWKERYSIFDSCIAQTNHKAVKVLEVGCGAISYALSLQLS